MQGFINIILYLKSKTFKNHTQFLIYTADRRGCRVVWFILSGLGPDDPGSNHGPQGGYGESPGSPIYLKKMARTKEVSTVKGLGPRYGRRIRHKLAKIHSEYKQNHKCPFCSREKVKRIAVGIWQCGKCNKKYTGRAYVPGKKITMKERVEKVEQEEQEKEAQEEQSSSVSQKHRNSKGISSSRNAPHFSEPEVSGKIKEKK